MPADLRKDLVLITSAKGKQAAHLIPLLYQWHNIRLVCKTDPSRQYLQETYSKSSNAIEVIQADITQSNDCYRILKGVTAVYHIGPAFHPRETEIGYNMIDAAAANGVQHFVYSSVLH